MGVLAASNKTDNVNHPIHYEGSTSIECIDAMEVAFGHEAVIYFCLCNAFKYMWRWKNKNGEEDLNKSKWYINKKKELNGMYFDYVIEEDATEKLEKMVEEAINTTHN